MHLQDLNGRDLNHRVGVTADHLYCRCATKAISSTTSQAQTVSSVAHNLFSITLSVNVDMFIIDINYT